jgi:hypothetical protein
LSSEFAQYNQSFRRGRLPQRWKKTDCYLHLLSDAFFGGAFAIAMEPGNPFCAIMIGASWRTVLQKNRGKA